VVPYIFCISRSRVRDTGYNVTYDVATAAIVASDVLKRHMKNGAINDFTWKKQALDRRKWRCILKKATAEVEEKRKNDYMRAHERRHSTVSHSNYSCPRCQRPCLVAHMRSYITS